MLQWEHSVFQGAGVEDFPVGHPILEFLGQFHQGLRHGAGICRYSDGAVYVGDWHKGKQHGIGRLVRPLLPPPLSGSGGILG